MLNQQLGGHKVYHHLKAGTIQHWIDTSGQKRKWKTQILQKVAEAKARSITKRLGRPGILIGQYALVKRIKDDLTTNRAAGIPISLPMTRALTKAHITNTAPDLLTTRGLQLSESFIQRFLHIEMGWSHQTVTRAAQKTPDNWENECQDMFMRIVYQVLIRNIPCKAIVNADQTSVCLVPHSKVTWAPTGAKQVDVIGKEEKRQFTLMVTTSCSGEFLPLQSIWHGKTDQSLPSPGFRKPSEALGNIWSAGGDMHWSNFACMKQVCGIFSF